MDLDIVDIDHLMVAVKDSARAGDVFERMGFTVTPRSLLPGLSNRLVCFRDARPGACNFIEFMALDDVRAAPAQMPEVLKDPDRPAALVVAAREARVARRVLDGGGLEVSPVLDLSREWKLPSGEVIVPAFSVVTPAIGQAPFYWILCQHKTPQHYLRADFVEHENGAVMLSAVIAVAQDPAQAAKHYARYWGASVSGGEPVVARCGAVELHIHSRAGFAENYPGIGLQHSGDHVVGFSVTTDRPDPPYALLEKAGFAPLAIGSRIALDQAQACGCLVVFGARHD